MSESVLEARNLSKHYGDLLAVDNLSLELRRGEVFGLLGPNGAGKTTSISMICGLMAPDEGSVLIQGQPVRNGDAAVRARVGVCPQEVIVWEKQTCREQLEFIGAMYDVPHRLARKRSAELLALLRLADKADTLAATLSGGMKRRLSIALAMVHDPEILVLDEPEAGLDPQSRVMVREMIRSLAETKTVLVTTHNMDEADRMTDRVAIIDHGRLLVLDTPEALKRSVGEGDVMDIDVEGASGEELVGALSAFGSAATPRENGVALRDGGVTLRGSHVVRRLPRIVDAIQGVGGRIAEVHVRANTLEDVFINLTGRGLRE